MILKVTSASEAMPKRTCQSIQSPPSLTETIAPVTQSAKARWNKRVGKSQIRRVLFVFGMKEADLKQALNRLRATMITLVGCAE
jgi:hypothetical protein